MNVFLKKFTFEEEQDNFSFLLGTNGPTKHGIISLPQEILRESRPWVFEKADEGFQPKAPNVLEDFQLFHHKKIIGQAVINEASLSSQNNRDCGDIRK